MLDFDLTEERSFDDFWNKYDMPVHFLQSLNLIWHHSYEKVQNLRNACSRVSACSFNTVSFMK